jgi:Icc-related predicted phosphoesterase
MNLYLVSDTHEEFWHNLTTKDCKTWSNTIPKEVDVLVLAGDIDTRPLFRSRLLEKLRDSLVDIPILYVDGNHEHYHSDYQESINNIKEECSKFNITYMDNSYHVIDGVTFYGGCLWSNFNHNAELEEKCKLEINDYRVIKNFNTATSIYKHNEFIHNFDKKADVVISHFSPSEKGCHTQYSNHPLNNYFHNVMDEFIEKNKPTLWLHGHTHHYCEYTTGETKVICNPRGYPRENYVVAGDYKGKLIKVKKTK